MNNFNLDINIYNCQELCELLDIPCDYSSSTIKEINDKLKKKIIMMDNPDLSKINDILLFLDNAENKLINNLK